MSDHARRAYEGFAPYYDAFTAHHDYDAWTRDLEALALDAGLRGRRLLDVACGTGKSFLPFLDRGYDVTACDISPAMLSLAADKAAGRASLFAGDMRDLPVAGAFDLVLCLDDALNYLLTTQELVDALTGIRANLAPEGVAVFDVNTLSTYRGFFASLSVLPSPDVVIVWRGRTPADLPEHGQARATTEVLHRQADGRWTDASQEHRQRHHPEHVVRSAARSAGLRLVGAHGLSQDGSMRWGADEASCTKTVYVASHAGHDHRPGTGTRGT